MNVNTIKSEPEWWQWSYRECVYSSLCTNCFSRTCFVFLIWFRFYCSSILYLLMRRKRTFVWIRHTFTCVLGNWMISYSSKFVDLHIEINEVSKWSSFISLIVMCKHTHTHQSHTTCYHKHSHELYHWNESYKG